MIEALHHITSLDHPALEPYRTLKRPLEHLRKNIFVAEGEKVVMRLLASHLRVYSLLLTPRWYELYRTTIERHIDPIEVFVGEKQLLDSIVGHDLHQAMMAIGKVPENISQESLASFVNRKKTFSSVLIDGVVNAENMGVIIRNCACFKIDMMMVLPTSCDPYLRRSVRNSMGNIFHLPIAHITPADILLLKQTGLRFYAAHPSPASTDIRRIHFAERWCIVFGSEGDGISNGILDLCDDRISIPMKPGIDSLNVASASAVVLYETMRGNDSLGVKDSLE